MGHCESDQSGQSLSLSLSLRLRLRLISKGGAWGDELLVHVRCHGSLWIRPKWSESESQPQSQSESECVDQQGLLEDGVNQNSVQRVWVWVWVCCSAWWEELRNRQVLEHTYTRKHTYDSVAYISLNCLNLLTEQNDSGGAGNAGIGSTWYVYNIHYATSKNGGKLNRGRCLLWEQSRNGTLKGGSCRKAVFNVLSLPGYNSHNCARFSRVSCNVRQTTIYTSGVHICKCIYLFINISMYVCNMCTEYMWVCKQVYMLIIYRYISINIDTCIYVCIMYIYIYIYIYIHTYTYTYTYTNICMHVWGGNVCI